MKKIILILILLFPILIFSQTKNIVPRADGEGSIGTLLKAWGNVHADTLHGLLNFENITQVQNYEPVMPDSGILLYLSGTWTIFDLREAFQTKENAKISDENYVSDAQLTVIQNTSGTNTGDNATNSQYSGLATSKANVTEIQSFIDSVYRSNDTIYFHQKDGTLLYFVDTGGTVEGDTSAYTLAQMDSLLALAGTSLQTMPTITLSGDVTGSGTTSITTSIASGVVGATEIASTSVTPGSYTNTNLTVDADGRITSASNGTGGVGTGSPHVWAYLQLDTTATIGTFLEGTDIAVSTLTESNITGVDANSVVRVQTDSAQYRVKYDLSGTPTWSAWTGSEGFYKDVDSIQARHYSSGSVLTSTDQVITVSNDTETFTTITNAGAFHPNDLNPIIYVAVAMDSTVAGGTGTVVSVTSNGYTFSDDTVDVNGRIQLTDSSFYFGYTAGTRQLQLADAGGNPFDLMIDGDMSADAWVYYSGDGQYGRIMAKGEANDALWSFGTGNYEGIVSPLFTVYNPTQDTVGLIKLTGTDTLEAGWHHIGISYDKGDSIAILYIDSVVMVTETGLEWRKLVNSVINTADATVIGETGLGHLAVLRFYRTVLTPANFKSLYEFGRN